jgi:hypothetical protein
MIVETLDRTSPPAPWIGPAFPSFKPLEPGDRAFVESRTRLFSPYSDFNFANLFAWDDKSVARVSELNGNLVVLASDYVTGEPFLSFLGMRQVDATAHRLIASAKAMGIRPTLRLIPEEIAPHVSKGAFRVEEDRESFDYIFSIPDFLDPACKVLSSRRRQAARFLREHPAAQFSAEKGIGNVRVRTELLFLHEDRARRSGNTALETIALSRFLGSSAATNAVFSCVRLGGAIVAYSIDELLHRGYALSHFHKSTIELKGLDALLNFEIAKHPHSLGVRYWNWEQDLGLEGLRSWKTSYGPVHFLKKYRVTAA